jgi:hypothetical protein
MRLLLLYFVGTNSETVEAGFLDYTNRIDASLHNVVNVETEFILGWNFHLPTPSKTG